MKCFLHEGQLFFETLERIPVHTDLIVAQANHGCDNGLPMIEAIAALMFGKFDYFFFKSYRDIFEKKNSALSMQKKLRYISCFLLHKFM